MWAPLIPLLGGMQYIGSDGQRTVFSRASKPESREHKPFLKPVPLCVYAPSVMTITAHETTKEQRVGGHGRGYG